MRYKYIHMKKWWTGCDIFHIWNYVYEKWWIKCDSFHMKFHIWDNGKPYLLLCIKNVKFGPSQKTLDSSVLRWTLQHGCFVIALSYSLQDTEHCSLCLMKNRNFYCYQLAQSYGRHKGTTRPKSGGHEFWSFHYTTQIFESFPAVYDRPMSNNIGMLYTVGKRRSPAFQWAGGHDRVFMSMVAAPMRHIFGNIARDGSNRTRS